MSCSLLPLHIRALCQEALHKVEHVNHCECIIHYMIVQSSDMLNEVCTARKTQMHYWRVETMLLNYNNALSNCVTYILIRSVGSIYCRRNGHTINRKSSVYIESTHHMQNTIII